MSSSTRAKAIELWRTDIPEGDKEKLAKTLFCVENPPGTSYISGSQDSIGIVYPGVNKLDYSSEKYWPDQITSVIDETTLAWIEKHLWLINLSPRENGYNVMSDKIINEKWACQLATSAVGVWNAIMKMDLQAFGKFFKDSFEAQIAMFPHMVNPWILEQINYYKAEAKGWKISGAGGGGYLVLVSDHPIQNGIQIKIRR